MLSALILNGVAARQLPCRTTGKLEATASRSSRPRDPFPPWPLEGGQEWEEPTPGYQAAGSIGPLARDEPVIPRVIFLTHPAPTNGEHGCARRTTLGAGPRTRLQP